MGLETIIPHSAAAYGCMAEVSKLRVWAWATT